MQGAVFPGRAFTLFWSHKSGSKWSNGGVAAGFLERKGLFCVCLETFLYLLMCVSQQPGNGPQKKVLFKENSSVFWGE